MWARITAAALCFRQARTTSRGYTAAEFNQAISDGAGVDVSDLLHRLIATTEEVDYAEMLDWFGLRFMTPGDPGAATPAAQPNAPARVWMLEVRPDATADQKARFAAFMAHSRAR